MKIPKEIKSVIEKMEKKKFQAYLVGGCVRDLLMKSSIRGGVLGGPRFVKKEPEDWDIATNAKPDEVQGIFKKSFANNDFGTVTVLTDSKDKRLKEVEITPFRTEEKYTDKRHPDKVEWAKTIEEDLARRDFTINAMALDSSLKVVDPFNGQKDLENRLIRAVGNPEDRFSEDALRMMRAVRLAAVLDFEIEKETSQAIKKNVGWLQAISRERIRDEFLKIIMADKALDGIELLRKLGLLKYIIPELEEGCEVDQNKHHIYGCYEHYILSLKYAVEKGFNKHVRLASLFHDIGKPRAKRGEGAEATFYNHEIIGAKMTAQILQRLKFSKKDIEKVVKLVRYHLFYYNVDEVGDASVRKLVRRMGLENMDELLEVRMADRIGSGVPKAEPYKLRHLRYLIEKVSKDPISVKKLKVNGEDIMKFLKIKPGPKIGWVLDILLSYVLDDPEKNKKDFLKKEVVKLGKLSANKLEEKAVKSRKERENIEMKEDKMTKKKYWVT